jgi:hypothetical protein
VARKRNSPKLKFQVVLEAITGARPDRLAVRHSPQLGGSETVPELGCTPSNTREMAIISLKKLEGW